MTPKLIQTLLLNNAVVGKTYFICLVGICLVSLPLLSLVLYVLHIGEGAGGRTIHSSVSQPTRAILGLLSIIALVLRVS